MTPLERAAKAAFEERERHIPGGAKVPWEKLCDTARQMAIAEVRAALKELREPTAEMVAAGGKALKGYIEALSPEERAGNRSHRGYEVGWREKMTVRWTAMVDEVLK